MMQLDQLNPEQRAAVTLPRASALILAGAGSGKTKVLTLRMAWLMQTSQVSPAGLLAVTFTNKAAKEMQWRLGNMLPLNIRSMWIGTFHGLCHRMLRAHWREAGLPQTFQILDMQDQQSLIKRMYKAQGVDAERYPAKQLAFFMNNAKEQGLRPAAVAAHDAHHRAMVGLYASYEALCQQEGVVDFAELLLRSFELLGANPSLCAHYQARFKYILVDEFQDTNALQYQWLKRLAGPTGCVFAVGDDDQSIYAFRGARVANMAQFEAEFAVQHRIKLEQNYRSVGNVLKAANALIDNNQGRMGKNLWTSQGDGEPVRVYEALSDLDEAAFVLEHIGLLTQGERLSLANIAVLYRSNAQSRVLEQALFNAGIPYRVYGGLRFFERAEVKHALAYLRLLQNPHDDGSFLRVVNFPARGIGAKSLEHLQDLANEAGSSLFAATAQLEGRAKASMAVFVDMIAELQTLAKQTQAMQASAVAVQGAEGGLHGLAALVQQLLLRTGLLAHYQAERDGQDRVENLQELVNAVASFQQSEAAWEASADAENSDVLSQFLAHAALEAGEHGAEPGQAAVQLMTVHAAKGLEFDAVFVTGLEEGLFPHENSVSSASTSNSNDGLEEERRLMYVAMTRARQQLFLTCAQQRMLHGQTRYHVRSRFLDELPEATLKWINARRSHVAQQGWDTLDAVHQTWQQQGKAGARGGAGVAFQNSSPRPFAIGTGVEHAKFGQGVVLAYEGQGQEQRVQVNFGRQGVKWLVLGLAKLSAA